MTTAAPPVARANPPTLAAVSRSPTKVAPIAVSTGIVVGTMSAASAAGAMVSATNTKAL